MTLPQTGQRMLECSPGWLLGTAYECNRLCKLRYHVAGSLQVTLPSSRIWAGSWGSLSLLCPASPSVLQAAPLTGVGNVGHYTSVSPCVLGSP